MRTYSVLGAIVWFAVKDEMSAQPEQSNIWLKLRRYDITTQATIPFIRGPKETIDSAAFPITDLNAGLLPETGYNYLPFNSPVLVTSPYGISVSFTEGMQAEDTLAIMHSADDSVLAVGQSWEIWNGNWRRMVDSWGLNVDFAVFPVIDTTLNSISSLPRIDFNIYPNPADNQISISLDQPTDVVQVEIIGINGQVVQISQIQGIKNESIDISQLSNGFYLMKITSLNQYGIRPFVVVNADK